MIYHLFKFKTNIDKFIFKENFDNGYLESVVLALNAVARCLLFSLIALPDNIS